MSIFNVLGISLLIVAFVLWILTKVNIIENKTLDRLEKIASIVSVFAALILFSFPYLGNDDPEPAAISAPIPTATPTPTSTPTQTPTQTATPTPTSTPIVTSNTSFYYLSLDSIATQTERLPESNLPLGLNDLAGITFDIRQRANTQCEYLPDGNRNLVMGANIPNVKAVHLLMSGTAVQKVFADQEVGIITLNFSNGQSSSVQLIAGKNIRNWALNRSELDITSLNDPNVQEALQFTVYLSGEDRTVIGAWDRLTIMVPEHLTDTILEEIIVTDTSHETVEQLNPCIYIYAVTIEYFSD